MNADTSSFMNLDALGDDIDRLLANSKNHQELCKLIGMDASQNKIPNQNKNPLKNTYQ